MGATVGNIGEDPSSWHPLREYVPFTKNDLERPLLARFEEIAGRFPDRPAVKDGDRQLSYRELHATVELVARAIVARLGPEPEPVALLFGVDIDSIIACLAVWRAGKFYVNLDPRHPRTRHAMALEDTEARLVITNRGLVENARAFAGARAAVMLLDELEGMPQDVELPPLPGPEAMAFLAYTSGTTGKPKAVVELCRNLAAIVVSRGNLWHPDPNDRIAFMHYGTTGGHSVLMMAGLMYGSCLLPFRFEDEGLTRFNRWLRDERITQLEGGAVLRAWLPSLDGPPDMPHLRWLHAGAAPLYREHVMAWLAYLPACPVFVNHYSATECRCMATFVFTRDNPPATRQLPVGYPQPWATIEIHDEAGRQLPPGETGEVVVFTPYLAAGYWRRPELTAEKFGLDDQGRSFYRTGDLGRQDVDGCLWVLGRRDGQVKIRGHRVETAEVESVLMEFPGVREAAVVAVGETDETRMLMAYVSLNDAATSPDELRRALQKRLPNAAVPRAVTVLEPLPRNLNGKIDRPLLKSLPVPSLAAGDADEAPVTATERVIAGLVYELLDGQRVGRQTDFFSAGGHSLLALRLLLKLQRRFGVDIAPATFLAAPTVAALAQAVDLALAEPKLLAVDPVQQQTVWVEQLQAGPPDSAPVFLIPGGGGSRIEALVYTGLVRALGPIAPVVALLAAGPQGHGRVYTSLDDLALAFVAALRQTQPDGPYTLVGECIGGKLAYEMARMLVNDGAAVNLLVLLDTYLPGVESTPTIGRRSLTRRLEYHWRQMRDRGWRSGLAYGLERLSLGLSPSVAKRTARSEHAVRSSYRAVLNKHRPSQRYGGRVVTIACRETLNWDGLAGWRELIPALEVHEVEGTHATYLSAGVQATAKDLRVCLAEARSGRA